ncbi:MAG: glycosyltransferase family 4 protein [Elusimicrobia bacterium]|nr:glycosyltransferase family 4 protein [Elusimicrobiota bacterium]
MTEPERVRLEDWARVPDPGWDRKGTGRLMDAAWSVNANSAWTKAYTGYWCPRHARGIKVVYYGAPVVAREAPRPAGPSLPWPYILCAARLGEYKGVDVLAMAFAEVASRVDRVRLVLAGADHSEGKLFAFTERLGLGDRVVWLGQQSHPRVLGLMRGSLFCVLPSRRESLGGAVIEAMAMGKAVVASRTGGIPELVTHGRSGLLVEPKDPAALARAMLRLLKDPAKTARMGSAARRRSRRFSWDRALDGYAREWASHPSWRPGGAVGFAVWDSGADQTCGAIAKSVMEGLRRRRQPFVLCCWRSEAGEPFRQEVPGGVVYRLGPYPRVISAQLGRIARTEDVAVWHLLVIRYRRLQGLLEFLRAARVRPVVTLA